MVDITHKKSSLRKAIATAVVRVSLATTIDAIVNKKVPKGDVFEMAKTAGLFAVKNTPQAIPDCHPLPVEFTSVTYKIEGLDVHVFVEVHTIYKTGVELEAMYGASVVTMTMYDMLKPIDKGIEVHAIKLLSKEGGKSDFKQENFAGLSASVYLISDAVIQGKKEDTAGQLICDKLEDCRVKLEYYTVIEDDASLIASVLQQEVHKERSLIVLAGGTGLVKTDVTFEAVEPMLEKRLYGIEEAMYQYGIQRTSKAMISTVLAGTIGRSLVLVIPGSTNGAKETMDALFPEVLYAAKFL